MLIDYYVCPVCKRTNPKDSICPCEIDRKTKIAIYDAKINLITDILIDIDNAMPAAPITKRAYNSWKEKYSDLLYTRNQVEDKKNKIMNGDL